MQQHVQLHPARYNTPHVYIPMCVNVCKWRHVDKRPWRCVTCRQKNNYIMCSGGGGVITFLSCACWEREIYIYILELLRRSWLGGGGLAARCYSSSWQSSCNRKFDRFERYQPAYPFEQQLQDSASLWWCKELAKVVFQAHTHNKLNNFMSHITKMSSQRRWDRGRNLR